MNLDETMNQVLETRYSNQEKAKKLCLKLLEYTKEHDDSYVEAFAYTYLGDYYIAKNEINIALDYLKKAEAFIINDEAWDKLVVRIYSLLGIVYEVLSDEQNSVVCYLEALVVAKKINDIISQCIILNNLAVDFQRHNSIDIAIDYLQYVYELQKNIDNFYMRPQILSNLGDLKLQMGNCEEARKYYLECEEAEKDLMVQESFKRKNKCCYYAAINDVEKARYWAKLILNEDNENKLDAFENFNMLYDAMLNIKDKDYAYKFLELAKAASIDTLDQLQILEDKRLSYSICFGDVNEQAKAYQRFYRKTQEFKVKIDESVVIAMKDKIYLNKLLQQKKQLQLEQESLEREANFDYITKLYNRRHLEQSIQKYNEMVNGYLGVIMIDVDYFKEYNDFYGHVEGDNVLYTVATCLKGNQLPGICAYRFGGDEFTCLCENVSNEVIELYIKKVREDLNNKFVPHSKSPCSDRITLSIGYVNRQLTNKFGVYQLLRLADEALYESKLSGRNTYKKK